MRLIDADKLIKRLEKWNTSDSTDKDLYNFAMNRIMEQPIAYDTDKVVEQLENDEKHTFDGCINKRYAIEIVKGGGVNG